MWFYLIYIFLVLISPVVGRIIAYISTEEQQVYAYYAPYLLMSLFSFCMFFFFKWLVALGIAMISFLLGVVALALYMHNHSKWVFYTQMVFMGIFVVESWQISMLPAVFAFLYGICFGMFAVQDYLISDIKKYASWIMVGIILSIILY